MKKLILLGLIALLMAFTLTACGEDALTDAYEPTGCEYEALSDEPDYDCADEDADAPELAMTETVAEPTPMPEPASDGRPIAPPTQAPAPQAPTNTPRPQTPNNSQATVAPPANNNPPPQPPVQQQPTPQPPSQNNPPNNSVEFELNDNNYFGTHDGGQVHGGGGSGDFWEQP